MVLYAPLTPELRARLSKSAGTAFLRRAAALTSRVDSALEAALEAAPNATAVARAATRLRKTPGVISVSSRRKGSTLTLCCVDRYVADVDRARAARSGDSVRLFESTALTYRTSIVRFRKRHLPQRRTMAVVYFEAHAIARLIERAAFDPRALKDEELAATLARAHASILGSLTLVEAALRDNRLDPDLAASFPTPSAATDGLWVVEPCTSGEDSCDGTVVTYLGASSLSPEQHCFATACEDGDFIGALRAYPDALRRTRATPATEAGLARLIHRTSHGLPRTG
jgi:hypothetical protein